MKMIAESNRQKSHGLAWLNISRHTETLLIALILDINTKKAATSFWSSCFFHSKDLSEQGL